MKKRLLPLIFLFLFAGTAWADCDLVQRMHEFNQTAKQLGESNPQKLESLHGELEVIAKDIEALIKTGNAPDRMDTICGRIDDMIRVLTRTP